MRVVAEGVETETQATYLRDAGCDELQGYLYTMPLLGEELMDFLDSERAKRALIA
jgi:EAL domain-containing protein (putative c-di-GMP-specific phosphodiesterase class I)